MNNPLEFSKSFVDEEYKLYQFIHKTRSDTEVDSKLEDFDKKFYHGDLFSSISRPGNMSDDAFEEYSGLISTRQKRRIFCLKKESEDTYQLILGAIDQDTDYKFELARMRLIDKSWKFISTYYTNFDDTFSYAGGESIGEIINDPCNDTDFE